MGIYDNCKISGPNHSKRDNRLRISIQFPDGKKIAKSYPKYLMEVHLDRFLEEDETVDHIDGNPLNNDLSNLQILDRKTHSSLDVLRNKDVLVTCKDWNIASKTAIVKVGGKFENIEVDNDGNKLERYWIRSEEVWLQKIFIEHITVEN